MKKSALPLLTASRSFSKVWRGRISKGAASLASEEAGEDVDKEAGLLSQPWVSARTKLMT